VRVATGIKLFLLAKKTGENGHRPVAWAVPAERHKFVTLPLGAAETAKVAFPEFGVFLLFPEGSTEEPLSAERAGEAVFTRQFPQIERGRRIGAALVLGRPGSAPALEYGLRARNEHLLGGLAMKLIRNSLAGVAFAALAVAACSAQPGSTGGASSSTGGGQTGVISNSGDIGQVHMNLDIPGGTSITSFTWTITNGTNTYTGTDPIGDAQSAEFVAGGILAGSGYTVTITGTDSNSDPCLGTSSAFTVTAGNVTQVVLGVVCTVPPDGSTSADVGTGTVEVDAGISLFNTGAVACPGISSFSISPAEINLAGTASLNLATVGPAASIAWTVSPANGGTFGSTTAASTTFQCANVPAAGSQVTVTATVALPDSGLCSGKQFTTMSALVNCESGQLTCGTGLTVCGPDGGAQACANLQTDVNNCGTCGNICPTGGAGTSPTCTTGTCGLATTPPSTPCTQIVGGKPADSTGNTNCVQCPGSAANNGTCTATEALIVQSDVKKGNVQASGQLKTGTGSCYTCLNAKGCLDDNNQDTGNECADTPDLSGGATGSGVTECLTTLTCIFSTDCQGAGGISGTSATSSQENVQLCYCGGNNAGSACSTAGTATNGACVTQEAAGFGFAFSDNKDILANYGSQLFPSGSANAIFQCGASNFCTACQ
jgi:hypothetical protein